MIDRILIVDDEFLIRQLLEETARRRGIETVTAASGEEAMEILEQEEFQMAFVDLKMGKASGLDVLRFAAAKKPKMLFVVMTAYGTVETAIEAIKLGAFDFVIKPFSPDQMDVLIEKARLWLQMDENNKYLRKEIAGIASPAQTGGSSKSPIVGSDQKLLDIQRLVQRVGPTDSTVLITGESGTGKELVASELARLFDPVGAKPYIRMNCAAIPETLLESELFGHEKGSFTGASERRIGRFELADGGTLLLDEIGEISPSMQAKLLRVLQERRFRKVGGTKDISCKATVIASSNRDLLEEVDANRFRKDLYYRLAVFPIRLHALSSPQRRSDIPLLAQYFLKTTDMAVDQPKEGFTAAAEQMLLAHDWPGNIRELRNVIARATIMEKGRLIRPESIVIDRAGNCNSISIDPRDVKDFSLESAEREFIHRALQETGWQRTKAAGLLGITRATLHSKLKRYGIKPPWNEDDNFDPQDGEEENSYQEACA